MKTINLSAAFGLGFGVMQLLCGAQVVHAKDYGVKEEYASMTAEGDATIVSAGTCDSTIGNGGNYLENKKQLLGKCEGAGLPAVIKGPRVYQKYVSFAIDPNYAGSWSDNDRTELGHTANFFPFGTPFQIGFRMMIPSSSSVSDNFFIPLQFWQCAPQPPIAALRIARGTSHEVQFVTRSDTSQATRFTATLTPDVWHQIVLSVNVSPVGGATFQVHMDGKLVGTSMAPYGYATLCAYPNDSGFRVKFGIYKYHEPGRYFEVNFDDFRVANREYLVKPWH